MIVKWFIRGCVYHYTTAWLQGKNKTDYWDSGNPALFALSSLINCLLPFKNLNELSFALSCGKI